MTRSCDALALTAPAVSTRPRLEGRGPQARLMGETAESLRLGGMFVVASGDPIEQGLCHAVRNREDEL